MKTIPHPVTKQPVRLVGTRNSNARVEAAIRLAEELREAQVPPEEVQAFVDAFLERRAGE